MTVARMKELASPPDGEAQSVHRIALILSEIAEHAKRGVRVADIAESSSLSRPAIKRLLDGLAAEGLVERDPWSTRYWPGHGLGFLAPHAIRRLDLRHTLYPLVRAIADRTQDTVHLSMRCGDESLCILREDGPYPIRAISLRVGDRRPLGIGTGSLTLLAFATDDAVERLRPARLAQSQAYQFGEAELADQIEAARERGFVYNRGFIVPGMFAVGLPIRSSSGEVFGALSISSVGDRMPLSRAEELYQSVGQELAAFEAIHGADYGPVRLREIERQCLGPSSFRPVCGAGAVPQGDARKFAKRDGRPIDFQEVVAEAADNSGRNLSRFLEILYALAAAPGTGVRSIEVSRSTGINPATTHRLLKGMVSHGVADEGPDAGSYTLGRRAAFWGIAATERRGLREASIAPARALCEATGDTVYVNLYSGLQTECIDAFEGAHPIRTFVTQPGERSALTATAFGLAVIEALEMTRGSDRPRDPAPLVFRETADSTIGGIKGIAIKRDLIGVNTVAVAVRDAQNHVVGAIGLSAISPRLDTVRMPEVVAKMLRCRTDVERRLAAMA